MNTGYVYSITNEEDNKVAIFKQLEDGRLEFQKNVPTNGKGTKKFSYFRGIDAPQLSTGAVAVTKDNEYLFVCNTYDNSVSSFHIEKDGDLTFIDCQGTNVNKDEHSLISLAYNEQKKVLYAAHFRGDHVATFKVDAGSLTNIGEPVNFNTEEFPDRFIPSVTVSPNGKYLLGFLVTDTPFSQGVHPSKKDNICVFTLGEDGLVTERKFFSVAEENYAGSFIDETRLLMTAVTEVNAVLMNLDDNGDLTVLDDYSVASQYGLKESQACWQAFDPKTSTIYFSNFGYGTLTSLKLKGDKLEVLNDKETFIPGGTFEVIGGIKASAPTDILYLNGFIYQIYAGVGILVAYSINDDGSLTELERYEIIELGQFGLGGVII